MELQLSIAASQRLSAWVLVYNSHTRRILMLKRAPHTNNPNLWNFPGGGVDGQNVIKAAKRELEEEAGVKVKKSDLVPIRFIGSVNAHYFAAVLNEASPRLRVDLNESSTYKWMTLQEIEALGSELHKKTAALVALPGLRDLLRTLSRAVDSPVPLT